MKSKSQQKRIRRTRRLLRGGKPVTTSEFESGLNHLKAALPFQEAVSHLENVKNLIVKNGNSVKGDDWRYFQDMKPEIDKALQSVQDGLKNINMLYKRLEKENREAREDELSIGVGPI